jgi:hypothetical protein
VRAAPPPRSPPNGASAAADGTSKSLNESGPRATETATGAAPATAAVPESRLTAPTDPDDDADDSPALEVAEVDLAQRRKRGRQLTLLDGTTIKLPTAKKRSSGGRRSEPSPGDELSAADVLAALRAAAHGVDSSDVLGENLRWEKLMAAILALLLRKHLVLERELLEELKKI